MDPSGSRAPPSQPPQALASQLSAMIRPEQVKRLPQLHESEKRKHEVIVSQLWNAIQTNPQNSPEWIKGFRSLREMSSVLMQGMKNFQNQKTSQDQQQQAQQAQQQRLIQQQQQAQMAQQAGLSNEAESSKQAGLNNVNQIAPHIQQKVSQYTFALPPQMAEGSAQAEQWLREARNRLAQATQRHEMAAKRKAEFQRSIQARNQSGNPFQPQEIDMINAKMLQCNKAIQDSLSFMDKFKNQQNSFREQARQSFEAQQQASATQVENTATQPEPAERPQQQQTQQQQPNMAPAGIKPLSITSAVSAAREQAMNPVPVKAEDGASPTATQQQSSSNPGQSQQTQTQSESSMSTTQPNGASVNFPSQPAGLQQPTSSTHAHPTATFMSNKKDDRPGSSKNFNVTAPRPVQMPPARPTLNGGPGVGMSGQLSEPAIPSMPGYVLEESEDGRVLGKEKLRELAREVLGPGDASYIHPEAEEVCYHPLSLPSHLHPSTS